ncbi:unnamed protein product, partial [Mesorhabditis spiculigera]
MKKFYFWLLLLPGWIWAKLDVKQSAFNKRFMATLADGDYEVVHPFQIRDKNERIGIDTKNYFLRGDEHYQHVIIVIRSNQLGRLKLVLERNNHLFFNQSSFRKLDSYRDQPSLLKFENCYYQGTVGGDSSSFVSMSSCDGLRGVIAFSNGTTFGIRPLDGGEKSRRHPHVLYRSQWPVDVRCGVAATSSRRARKQRRDLSKQTKFIEIAAIADYELAKAEGLEEKNIFNLLLEVVNTADLMISRDLNVRLTMVYSEQWLDAERIDIDEDINKMLHGLVDYATGHLYGTAKDMTFLLTNATFANIEYAVGTTGSVCTARAAALVKSVSPFHSHLTAQLLAQQISHLIGLDHDAPSCKCPGGVCVMNQHVSRKSSFAWQFSKCSVAKSHSVWARGNVHCLLNEPFQEWKLRECGNGIVDHGEECDCGPREKCQDPCCDALTCTLRPHAQCAAHQDCCYRCQIRRAGEICRPSNGSCDVAEVCDGTSGNCPANGYLVDGTACGDVGQCWRGACSDPRAMCTKIWGHGANVGQDECFAYNTRGHEFANCGQDGKALKQCEIPDVRCGSLYCTGGSPNPIIQVEASTLHLNKLDETVECKSISYSANSLLALTPDGSACGSGRVCVAGSCVDAKQVSTAVFCPSNNHALQCSGHGDCTTTAVCVCFAGWTGQACDTRLRNNSFDLPTGPVVLVPSIAAGKSLDTPTLLGILLIVGLILLLLLVFLLFCYRRRSFVDISQPKDEYSADGDGSPDDAGRSIKFGKMPSYREEKQRHKNNKPVYRALNRIQEAEERERVVLTEYVSSSQHSLQCINQPDDFPIHDEPAEEWERGLPGETAPLKLSNLGLMLKQLGGSGSPCASLHSEHSHHPFHPVQNLHGSPHAHASVPSDSETSGVEVDHSGEETRRSPEGSILMRLQKRWEDDKSDDTYKETSRGDYRTQVPGANQGAHRLFSDSFQLEMSHNS